MAKSFGGKHWDMALMDELDGSHPSEIRLKDGPGASTMASVSPGGNGSAVGQPSTQPGHPEAQPESGIKETDKRVVSNKKIHLVRHYQYLTGEITKLEAEVLLLQNRRAGVVDEIIGLAS